MELEKFDIEKAKAGRKLVDSQNVEIVKWDIFGDTITYLLKGDDTPSWVRLGHEHTALFLAPEERYVNLYGDTFTGEYVIHNDLDIAKDQNRSKQHDFQGTYKLVKV